MQQYCCAGLNFGYYYDGSPLIAYDSEAQPAYSMGGFTASTVPGCHVPHFTLADGASLYDRLGPDYTLLRFDPAVLVEALLEARARVRRAAQDAGRGSRAAARRVSSCAAAGASGPARGLARRRGAGGSAHADRHDPRRAGREAGEAFGRVRRRPGSDRERQTKTAILRIAGDEMKSK
ncbi:MAG: hypothetical protein MO853_00480 [Candidatus Protistobacter heckmanni]|nr:hypothetical protein [Candidatus Protistobacter heckmanni]